MEEIKENSRLEELFNEEDERATNLLEIIPSIQILDKLNKNASLIENPDKKIKKKEFGQIL